MSQQHPHEPHEVAWDRVHTHTDGSGHQHHHFRCQACGHIGSMVPRVPGRRPSDPQPEAAPPLHFCRPPKTA